MVFKSESRRSEINVEVSNRPRRPTDLKRQWLLRNQPLP